MHATITQQIEQLGPGHFRALMSLYDDYGSLIDEAEVEYRQSNEPYTAYKGIGRMLNGAQRFEVSRLDIRTNSEAVANELGGERNPNARLLEFTHERMERLGIELENVAHYE